MVEEDDAAADDRDDTRPGRFVKGLPGVLKEGALSDGTLSDGTLSEDALSDGALSDGTLNDGALSDGTLRVGALSDGAPSDGTVSEGTLSDGRPDDGTLSDGTLSDGRPVVSGRPDGTEMLGVDRGSVGRAVGRPDSCEQILPVGPARMADTKESLLERPRAVRRALTLQPKPLMMDDRASGNGAKAVVTGKAVGSTPSSKDVKPGTRFVRSLSGN